MFYSLFVHSCVFLLFRELSVPISSLHFTICWFGGWRMVRCSLGSAAGLQACLRGTWTRQSHQPPPRLPPNPWHPQELPERVDFVSLALIYVQPFCFGFKIHFSKQIAELKTKTKNKSVVHEFCIKSFLQESSFSVCSIATRVRVLSPHHLHQPGRHLTSGEGPRYAGIKVSGGWGGAFVCVCNNSQVMAERVSECLGEGGICTDIQMQIQQHAGRVQNRRGERGVQQPWVVCW